MPLEEYVRDSILKPDEYVVPGYSEGVMPAFDGLSEEQLDALVQYLTGGGEGGAESECRGVQEQTGRRCIPGRLGQPVRGLRWLTGAGLAARGVDGRRSSSASASASSSSSAGLASYEPVFDWELIVLVGALVCGAGRLPDRPRRVRLLALLHLRPADAGGGPLRARRLQLEGLLPGQHRPQGDRRPVRRARRSSSS